MAPATRSNSGNERLPTTPEELETLVSGRIAQALAEHNATRTERSRDRTGSDRRETSPTGKKTSGICDRSLRENSYLIFNIALLLQKRPHENVAARLKLSWTANH